MIPRRRRLPGALALAVVAGLHAGAAQVEPIRAGIDLVTVDFSAVGADGVPLGDLAPEEVTLRVDGRPRAIKSFQYVQVAAPAPLQSDDGGGRELPPPFGSNYVGDAGRTVILIVENESLRAAIARHATDAASAFVRDLSPRDRVALVTMPRGGLQMDLTRDHARVRELIKAISGQGSQRTTASEHACRSRETLTSLTGLLEGLASIDLPKTVVFISSGILTPRRDAPLAGPPGQCEIRPVAYEEVGTAAIGARANFYVIRPEDLVVDSAINAFANPSASRFQSTDEEMAGLESLAGVTSGQFLRMTPTDHSAFARVIRESAGYYMAAFEPDRSERNGLSHRVEVDVSRPGVTIRQRPRVSIPKPVPRGSAASLTPQAMLRDGRMYRDLPLRAAAYASAGDGDARLKIIALAEALDQATTLTSAAFALIDARGRLVAQWTANDRELGRTPVMSAGLAPAGPYRLRVAALDNLGRRGAADYEFTAALTPAGPLRLSALVAGVSRGGFLPRLQFRAEPTATGMFELYGSLPETAAASVALELAKDAEGPALVTVPAALVATEDPARRIATGVVPIGAFPAGDYLLRGTVTIDGTPAGQVSRTIRKAIR